MDTDGFQNALRSKALKILTLFAQDLDAVLNLDKKD